MKVHPSILEVLTKAGQVVDGQRVGLIDYLGERVYALTRSRGHTREIPTDVVCNRAAAVLLEYKFQSYINATLGFGFYGTFKSHEKTNLFSYTKLTFPVSGDSLAVIVDWPSKVPDHALYLLDFSDIDWDLKIEHPERHLIVANFK